MANRNRNRSTDEPFVADPDGKGTVDLSEFERGHRGPRTDPTPDAAYTVAGVTSSDEAAQASRKAGGGGGTAPLTDEEQADRDATDQG